MRILVTGAAGFLGSHLVEALAAKGHDVNCLVRPGRKLQLSTQQNISVVDCGMDSPEEMAGAVSGVDTIFHLAGVTKAPTPQGYIDGNVNIAKNLVTAIKRYGKKVEKLVFVSSQAAAGPHPGPNGLTESDPAKPISHYGHAKLATEQVMLELRESLLLAIVRPPMVYGPRDTSFTPMYSAARKGLFPIFGSRKTLMSIIHVDDLIRGILGLSHGMDNGRVSTGSVYYISGQIASWEEIGLAVGSALGHKQLLIPIPFWCIGAIAMVNGVLYRAGIPTTLLVPDKWREIKAGGWVCDDTKARKDFGYIPKITLADGMMSTI